MCIWIEAPAEHIKWSRISRVPLIWLEFSSLDQSRSWHCPGLQHFEPDRKKCRSIIRVSNVLEIFFAFFETHPLDWSCTDWHLSSPQRFWLTSVRSMWICFVSKPCSGNRIQFTIRKYDKTAPANQRMIGAKPYNQTAFDLDLEVSGCFTIHVYLMHYSSESERSIWGWVSSESELV